MRHPLALLGTVVAGFAMGVAEVMPGFSGGTVALVSGIYERLIAVIRQAVREGVADGPGTRRRRRAGSRRDGLAVRARPRDRHGDGPAHRRVVAPRS